MRTYNHIRVFLFHRIAENRENWAHPTGVKIFEKCLQYITGNFTVKTVEECLALQGSEIKGKGRPLAALTFDDGFRDNIKYALPLLEKYKCPASFYIVTDCIDSGLPTWQHLFQNLFHNTKKLRLDVSDAYFAGGINKTFADARERIAYGNKLLGQLYTSPGCGAVKVMEEVTRNFNDVPVPERMTMTWDELRQLSSAGYTIGSHTCSHPLLTQLQDAYIRKELVESAERIEKVCRKRPGTIAYPLGVTDNRVQVIAQECGYKYGLSVEQKFYNHSEHHSMAVPRVDVYAGHNWLKTYLRMTGDLEKVKRVLGR